MQLVYSRHGREYAIETDNLPAASLAYLLQYGWSQSLQDSMAGPTAKAKADKESAESIETLAVSCLEKRAKAIADGTVGVRVGQARDPERKVALEMLKAFAKSKGKKLPEDKADLEALLTKFRSANVDRIKAEVTRRAEALVEVELD